MVIPKQTCAAVSHVPGNASTKDSPNIANMAEGEVAPRSGRIRLLEPDPSCADGYAHLMEVLDVKAS